MASPAQIKANRANAQFSSGPSSPEGKETCSKNALKTALTGRTILLPTDDVAAYESLAAILCNQFNPQTDAERLIVQSILDTEWRLLRIPVLQSGLLAIGVAENTAAFPDEPHPDKRAIMLEGLSFRSCQKELGNLSLQEGRLRRSLEKLTAQFEKLRHEREILELARRDVAMRSFQRDTVEHPSIGSEFSHEYLMARLEFKLGSSFEYLAIFDRSWRDKNAKAPS